MLDGAATAAGSSQTRKPSERFRAPCCPSAGLRQEPGGLPVDFRPARCRERIGQTASQSLEPGGAAVCDWHRAIAAFGHLKISGSWRLNTGLAPTIRLVRPIPALEFQRRTVSRRHDYGRRGRLRARRVGRPMKTEAAVSRLPGKGCDAVPQASHVLTKFGFLVFSQLRLFPLW